MNSYFRYFSRNCKCRQKGAVLPLIVICLILFILFAALAIDLGYLFTGRNQLQNAADAAALGATRQLGVIYKNLTSDEQNDYDITDANKSDISIIQKVAEDVAKLNQAMHEGIVILNEDIELGIWDPDKPGPDPFTKIGEEPVGEPKIIKPTAVRVTARRTEPGKTADAQGQIATFFSGIFGKSTFPVSARATAALTGQGTTEPGELELPVGIDHQWFKTKQKNGEDFCGDIIKFSPTDNTSCAGWMTFNYQPANVDTLTQILLPDDDPRFDTGNIKKDHLEAPASSVNDPDNPFWYIGGLGSAFDDLLLEYARKGVDVDKVYNPNIRDPQSANYDPDYVMPKPVGSTGTPVPLCSDTTNGGVMPCSSTGTPPVTGQLTYPCLVGANIPLGCKNNDSDLDGIKGDGGLRYAHEWETTVVVYADQNEQSDDCKQSNQSATTIGYARVTLYNVGQPGDKVLYARVECNFVSNEDTRGGGVNLGILGTIPGLVE